MNQDEIRAAAEAAYARLGLRDEEGFEHIEKCGVLPVRQTSKGGFEYYLMRPIAQKPELGAPGFQICKGTRDPVNGSLERLGVTALREGIEEIGLRMGAIAHMEKWGEVSITSASSGEEKPLYLYLVHIKNGATFAEPSPHFAATEECRWKSLDRSDDVALIRPDYLGILQEIDAELNRRKQAQQDVGVGK